jgi:hypothetical protein
VTGTTTWPPGRRYHWRTHAIHLPELLDRQAPIVLDMIVRPGQYTGARTRLRTTTHLFMFALYLLIAGPVPCRTWAPDHIV